MKKIAFNTANLVAQFTGWRFQLSNWGQQDQLTREKTDERVWQQICRDIAAAGYRGVEIWVAHVDPARFTDQRAATYRKILDDNGLEPIGLAAALTEDTARVCQQLGIPACNGGLWGTDLASVKRLARSTGIRFNYENHPEKSVEQIRAAIGGGGEGIGVAVDIGWLATQGIAAPAAIRELGPLVTHVHVKDVAAAGAHHTRPLGKGIAGIEACLATLKSMGYSGWYSWEDEPEDRNPWDIARAMREWLEERIDA
jgi:sugar phosphate isomerase/epimerase